MSNALAIATVTTALRLLITRGLDRPGIPGPAVSADVTAQPPDQIDTNNLQKPRVNLFLFHVAPNAAWRNRDIPGRVKPGEIGMPPVALTLQYLITVYGVRDGAGQDDHILLGRVLGTLHDHSTLTRADIRNVINAPLNDLTGSDLDRQIEAVRLSPVTLSPEEWSKVWSALQVPARLSVVYEASPVLIESETPPRAALPVLGRGDRGDPGFPADAGVAGPEIDSFQPRLGGRPGDEITIQGRNLGAVERLSLAHPLLPRPIVFDVAPDARSETSIRFTWPDPPDGMPAGLYSLTAQVRRVTTPGAAGADPRYLSSNALALPLLPRIVTVPGQPLLAERGVDGNGDPTLTLTVKVSPLVMPGQSVSLILQNTDVPAPVLGPNDPPVDSLVFNLLGHRFDPGVATYARVRIDGVDSLAFDPTSRPPKFDPDLQVVIPPEGGPP